MQPKAAHAINETDKEKNGITQCHDYHKVDLFPSVVIPVVIEFYLCPRLAIDDISQICIFTLFAFVIQPQCEAHTAYCN